MDNDLKWMRTALSLAHFAESKDEVPVGALIVQHNRLLATGTNVTEADKDSTGHAELIALRRAGQALGDWRLNHATLYVTLEPCLMCAGAVLQSRLSRVVFGAWDHRAGAFGSRISLQDDDRWANRPTITAGVLAAECEEIIRRFFQAKR